MRRSSHSRRELSARRSCAICATSPRASGAKTSFSSSLPHSSGGKAVRACSRARDACAGSASSRASSLAAPAGWAKPIGRWLSPAKADAPRLLVRMTAAPEKSIRRPRPSVSCPSSRIWSNNCRTARCAFSASSRSTTHAGRRRTASVSRPPSPYPTYPGGAHQPRTGVRFRVFREIDPDEGAVEELVGERARRLRLSHSGRSAEEKGGQRALRGEAGIIAPHGAGDGREIVLMPNDAAGEPLLQAEEALAVRLQEAIFRQSRHPRDRSGDVFARHLGPPFAARARAGEVDRRERLVGQAAVANVARREVCGRFQCLGKKPYLMMVLVLRRRAAQDARRVRRRWLAHQHRNEASLQRRIGLDVLLEFIVG